MGDGMVSLFMTTWEGVQDYQCQEFMQAGVSMVAEVWNMMQPGGNYRHTTSCDKASECLFFVESSGKFDLKPVEVGKD